jgi:uncharacterized protein YecT (DUF1311 family)
MCLVRAQDMPRLFVLCVLLLGSVSQVGAQTPCTAEETTPEISACLQKEVDKIEIELTYIYRKTLGLLPGQSFSLVKDPVKLKVIAAERAWIAYRTAQCDGFVAKEWENGSGQGGAVLSCRLRLTKARIVELKSSVF